MEKRVKILIVDDATEIAALFRVVLEHDGFDVVASTTEFHKFPEWDWGSFDLAMIDQFLPDCDGKAILVWVAEHYPQVKRVLLTADHQARMDNTPGADLVFIKPAGIADIVKNIRKLTQ